MSVESVSKKSKKDKSVREDSKLIKLEKTIDYTEVPAHIHNFDQNDKGRDSTVMFDEHRVSRKLKRLAS